MKVGGGAIMSGEGVAACVGSSGVKWLDSGAMIVGSAAAAPEAEINNNNNGNKNTTERIRNGEITRSKAMQE